MSKPVLDASAILATLYGESGADIVDGLIRNAAVSTVNAAEVISKLVNRGMTGEMALSALRDTGVEIISFDLDQAALAGSLIARTQFYGLSLGDRACLALATLSNGPAYTADRKWAELLDLAVKIVLIR